MRRPAVLLILLLASHVLPHPAFAQTGPTDEIESARALGMGGAFRAMAYDDSAVDLNPAALAQMRKFDLELGYDRAPATRGYGMHFAMGDSLTNSTASGFAFDYRRGPIGADGKPLYEEQRYIIAASSPIIPQALWIGVSSKYVKVDYAGLKARTAYTGDLDLLARPAQWIAIAGGFENLVNGNQKEAPRGMSGGVAIVPTSWAAIEGDVFTDFASTAKDKTGYAFGGQVLPWHWIALRGGWYEEALSQKKTLTLGLGLNAERGTIDYAVRFPEGDRRVAEHYVTISFLAF